MERAADGDAIELVCKWLCIPAAKPLLYPFGLETKIRDAPTMARTVNNMFLSFFLDRGYQSLKKGFCVKYRSALEE